MFVTVAGIILYSSGVIIGVKPAPDVEETQTHGFGWRNDGIAGSGADEVCYAVGVNVFVVFVSFGSCVGRVVLLHQVRPIEPHDRLSPE